MARFAQGVGLAPMFKYCNANRMIFAPSPLLQKFILKDLILSKMKLASLKWALFALQWNSRLH